ncbi:MAG: hypothetical protein E7369_01935 [Clostridiales bacterium]|nr:hypothetical protein [Clostridiales bacterium]
MINVKKFPLVTVILLAVSLVFCVIGFIMHFYTYDGLNYELNRWVVALSVIGIWSILVILLQRTVFGGTPFWFDAFYLIGAFCIVLASLMFLSPCLANIGIYFTVNNMGDVEANAIGVPRCICAMVFYVLSFITFTVSSFFGKGVK